MHAAVTTPPKAIPSIVGCSFSMHIHVYMCRTLNTPFSFQVKHETGKEGGMKEEKRTKPKFSHSVFPTLRRANKIYGVDFGTK